MSPSSFIDDESLARASFLLLASSGITSYQRVAESAASTVQTRLVLVPGLAETAVAYAYRLADILRRSEQRGTEEPELAILLAALAQTAYPGVSRLLQTIGLEIKPTLVWVAALARRLLAIRPIDVVSVTPTVRPAVPFHSGRTDDAASWSRPMWRANDAVEVRYA